MLKLFAILIPLASVATSAFAVVAAIKKQLEKLDPSERMEQACDAEAMKRIGTDKTGFKPDKVIAYAFGDTIKAGNSIRAPGAVFRAGGDWYRLKFKCETGEEGLKIMSFDFKIGDKVPKEQWEKYYLYN